MSNESLVVRAHRPWRYRIAFAILLLAACAAVAYAYVRGLNDGGYYHGEVQSRMSEKSRDLEQAEVLEEQLRQRVAVLERGQEVDQAARESLRQEVMSLQDEIHGLREELAFYRGIVSPEEGQTGLQIQDFSIREGEEPGRYRFSLTLIQALRHDRRMEGMARLVLHGRQEGESKTLPLSEVSDRGELGFDFRYFQNLDGRIDLPEGFAPSRVTVRVSREGGDEPLEEDFEWPGSEG